MTAVLPRATETHRNRLAKVCKQVGWPRSPYDEQVLDLWLAGTETAALENWTPALRTYMIRAIRFVLGEKRLPPALREGFESLLCDTHTAFGSSAVDMLADLTRIPAGFGDIAISVGGKPTNIGPFAGILEGLIVAVDALAAASDVAIPASVSTAARRIEAAR